MKRPCPRFIQAAVIPEGTFRDFLDGNQKTAALPGDHPSRRGAVMVFALIALLVASMMIGALLRTAAMSHRQLKRDEFRLQASLLADAGCERARAILRSQPDFSSGEWNVPAEQLAPNRTAVVRMALTTVPDQPTERIVSATAEYPIGHPDHVRITRQIRLR